MMRSQQLNGVTQLARAGALEQAWALFNAGGYASGSDDPDALTVYGRLLKDRAARAKGPVREELLNEAISVYERASELSRATYPLINAATLAFMAGRRDYARKLAAETIKLLDSNDCAPETPYWLDATRAEALLLLDRPVEAEAVFSQAIRHQPEAWEDHASTLRQFSLIVQEMGASESWLDRYRPPPCLHFDGILGIAADDLIAQQLVEQQISAMAPGNVIGALAAGADILIAESAIRNGGHLHAVLPCPPELFREASVKPFGPNWERRFESLMEQAASVLILDDWHALSNASVVVAREAAMGLAIRESRRFQSSVCALRIRAQGEDDVPPADRDWDQLGLARHSIWIERSHYNRVALPTLGKTVALLAAPEALEADLQSAGSSVPLGKQNGHVIYGFSSLAEGALLAGGVMMCHPEARIGFDYRAMLYGAESAQRWDRALTLASASLAGAVALSETAALALSLEMPSANVQPMGLMRARTCDLPIFGLFPDPESRDQLSQ